MKYIFDTSSAIILIEICKLAPKLLEFSSSVELIAPAKVRDEFLEGTSVEDALSFQKIFKIVSPNLKEDLLPYFHFDSNCGEFWVVSYSCENSDCCCVIDEAFGRERCNFLDLKLTGSIGIIKEMKKIGLINREDIRTIKSRIKQSDFYCTEELLKELDS